MRYLQLRLTGDADPEVVERVLAEVRHDDGTDPQSEVLLLYLDARWSVIQGVPAAEAVRLLLDAVHEGFVHNGALDSLARAIVYESDALDPAYAEVLGPRAAGEGFDAQVAGVGLAGCHLMAGRVEESVRVLDALETPSSRVGAVMETSARVMRGISLYATGEFPQAYEQAVDGAQRAISDLDRMDFAGYSSVGALAQVALGSFEEAQDALDVVLSAGMVSRPMTFAPDRAILVLMAVISTRTGHEGAAASFVEHADQVVGTTDALPFGSTGWAEAVAVAGSGQSDVAARVFADVRLDADARGFHLAGDVATMSSLLVHFEPELAEGFREQAGSLGGGLYGAQLDARAAAHDRDPLRLEAAARAVHERGAASDALTYLTLAVRLFREQGMPDGAARAQAAAHSVASALGVPVHLVAGLGEPEFTSRERELIQLVAAGRSNAEIAAQLFIGLRTVESHLRNIRRKSGAGERQDIADLA